MFNSIKLTRLAASVSAAMGIQAPNHAEPAIEQVLELVKNYSVSGRAQKVFIYNPDCLAFWLYQKYTKEFSPVMARMQLTLPVVSVYPPVTPVCFASMYTGAQPSVHGIVKYEKPIVRVDTLFDAFVRAGKKVALIAETDSSMSKIFLERGITYITGSPEQVEEEGLKAILRDEYDVVIVYQMKYDDMIHETSPESKPSYLAFADHMRCFARLADAVKTHWNKYDTLLVHATDHGLHTNEEGQGDHGDNIPEDMNVAHFYGFYPAE